jgi:hypothetical protein
MTTRGAQKSPTYQVVFLMNSLERPTYDSSLPLSPQRVATRNNRGNGSNTEPSANAG